MPREEFNRELSELRALLLRMGGTVESQISSALEALRHRDSDLADRVRQADRDINEMFREIRERCFLVISKQQPVARDLRTLMGVLYIAGELERIGDYAVRIARFTGTLANLPSEPLRPELGVMAQLSVRQVHDILDSLIEMDEPKAREVAAKDDEIDRLYHRLSDELLTEMGAGGGADEALRRVTLMLVAHNLERICDRVTNVAEDIVFLESGQVVELG